MLSRQYISGLIGLLILVFVLSLNSFAQRSTINGVVTDNEKQPLPGASVIIPDLRIGTISDDQGKFSLQLEATSVTLMVSYIGYNSRTVRLTKQELLKTGEVELKIELVPVAQEIGAVSVVGEKRTTVVEKPRESVLDFDFLNDELLVLISNKKGYRIQRYNEDFEPLGALHLQEKPVGLYKDCMGGLHVKYRKHADELEILGKGLGVRATYGILDFNRLLSPCIVATDSDIYFRSTEQSNQRITYFAKNKETKEARILHVIEETERLEMIQGTRDHIADLRNVLATETFATQSDRLAVERDIQQYEWFDQMILSTLTYHPLFLQSDSLFVFDHYRNALFVYDETGNNIRQTPLTHHLTKDWAELILLDEKTGKFYLDIAGSGISILHAFDTKDGSHSASLVISDHTFPEKMKVRNNKVWYIHQDLNQDSPALYMMDLPIDDL